MLRARNVGQKKQRESPGFDRNHEYKGWITSHGDVTAKLETGGPRFHRRVTFEQPETFDDAEEPTEPTPVLSEEIVNNEWGVDGDDSPHPSTEHRERVTWHLIPSRRLIRPREGRHRESYDMDLLPFQAGSYASDEKDYLKSNLDGNLIDRVKLEAPEEDIDVTETTDDRPGQAHSTDETDTAWLASQSEST